MKQRISFLAVFVLAVTASWSHATSKSSVSKKSKLPVFANNGSPNSYETIGDIDAKSHNYYVLLTKMREKGKKIKADAIIGFSTNFETKKDWIFGGSKVNFIGNGIAIRWTNAAVKEAYQQPPAKVLRKGGVSCKEASNVPVFETDAAPNAYLVLGKIYANELSPEGALCLLKKEVKKFGGDAVVNYQLMQQEFTSEHHGVGNAPSTTRMETANIASGVLVRWARPEEKGLTNLAEADKMLILILD